MWSHKDQVMKGSCDFILWERLSYVSTLKCVVAIGNKNTLDENISHSVQWKQSDPGHIILCNKWWNKTKKILAVRPKTAAGRKKRK